MSFLYLVRHGQSGDNAAGLLQGQADPPLTDLGREEALRLRDAMPTFSPDHVVSSDLQRAAETAALIGYPTARRDPRLREIDVGSWQGRPLSDFPSGPEVSWRGGPLHADDAESWEDLQARIGVVVDELIADGGTWLVVCHGGVIRAAVSHITGADSQRVGGPANASVTLIGHAQLVVYDWTPALL